MGDEANRKSGEAGSVRKPRERRRNATLANCGQGRRESALQINNNQGLTRSLSEMHSNLLLVEQIKD